MTVKANTCEGTNGAALAATNVGAPDAFNTSTKSGTGTTATFDNAHVHGGATAIKFSLAAISSTDYVDWSGLTTASGGVFGQRFYMYATANPTANTRLCAFVGTTGTTLRFSVQWLTTGLLRSVNSAGGTGTSTTNAVPLNQWVRIESWCDTLNNSATPATGTVYVAFYSGANLEGSTPDTGGSITSTVFNINNTAATSEVTVCRPGMSSAVVMTSVWNVWYDDVAFSDVSVPVGPLPAGGPSLAALRFRQLSSGLHVPHARASYG